MEPEISFEDESFHSNSEDFSTKSCRRLRSTRPPIANEFTFKNDRFLCNHCDSHYSTKSRVRQHLQEKHFNVASTTSDTLRINNLIRASNRKPRQKRPAIANDFTFDEVTEKFTCKHCQKVYNSKITVRKHLQDKHGQDQPETCEANDNDDLESSSSDQACNKITKPRRSRTRRPPVANDFTFNHEFQRYSCNYCFKTFLQKSAVRLHLAKNHDPMKSSKPDKMRRIDYNFFDDGNKIDCQLCPRKFSSKESLEFHFDAEHNPDNVFKCGKCDEGFCKTLEVVQLHRMLHDSPPPESEAVQCQECLRICKSSMHLYHHMYTHREKNMCCDHCDRRFNIKQRLMKHLWTHFGIKDKHKKTAYEKRLCEICSTMIGASAMKRHILTRHTDFKPFKCDEPGCKWKFFESRHLQEHKNIHTGAKPHICEYCNEGFNHRSALRTHLIRHTDPERFKCNVCDQFFVNALR